MFRRIWVLTKQTWLGFTRDNCTQQAAAISYYALFSVVPVAILVVSIIGIVLTDEGRRTDLVNQILDTFPLSDTEGREAVERAVNEVQRVSGPIAAFGVAGTIWTSSAMFGSIRRSLNMVWRVDEYRPYFRGKLVDFAQVGVLGLFLLASMVLTGILRTAREVSTDVAGPLAGGNLLWEIPPVVLPLPLTLVTFAMLYRYVPAAHPRWRDALPGALFATLLFEAMKNSFALYVANYNNFDVVYGSLAGVLLFLLYTYLSSSILLAGAELAHVFQRYHAGELESQIHPVGPQTPMAVQAFRAFKGLFVRQ